MDEIEAVFAIEDRELRADIQLDDELTDGRQAVEDERLLDAVEVERLTRVDTRLSNRQAAVC